MSCKEALENSFISRVRKTTEANLNRGEKALLIPGVSLTAEAMAVSSLALAKTTIELAQKVLKRKIRFGSNHRLLCS